MLAKSTSDMSKKEKLKPYQCKCRLDELVPSPVLRNKIKATDIKTRNLLIMHGGFQLVTMSNGR